MNPLNWVRNNKLASVLILFVLYLLFAGKQSTPLMWHTKSQNLMYSDVGVTNGMMGMAVEESMPAKMMVDSFMPESVSPEPSARMTVTENYLSLQVSDVSQTISEIKSKTESLSGFMVNSNVSRPDESANGSITVRVPVSQADTMIQFLKDNSIKVVSENVQGRDVTDQYQDIDSRLSTLTKNKARFEEIMNQAESVNEILQVQNQIFQLQSQIDRLIGQQQYLKDTSETVKITIYLSTDEYSLPYIPDTSWRPGAVLKEAIRSLILDIRGLANKLIWITVYAVIWIPLAIIGVVIIRSWKSRKTIVKSSSKKN